MIKAIKDINLSPQEIKTLCDSARHVFKAESIALQHMAEVIDEDFAKTVDLLSSCEGRAIISGMGKSGHIARKIAASLASTGTPSFFVHPGEASHGDLGMVTRKDIVILISNSGEAPELADLIAYTRRFDIPMIAITSKENSTLGKAADLRLILPPEREVCPMGLAPTTSTTMTLAMGDALAVATLEKKGFTEKEYRNFHPGGKLGKRLLLIDALMHKGQDIPLAKMTEKMSNVLVTMTEKSLGCVGVVDGKGKLVGIITDGDLRRHMSATFTEQEAATIMTANPMTLEPTALAAEALRVLNEHNRTQLFIVDKGTPVGVLHIHDLLRAGIA